MSVDDSPAFVDTNVFLYAYSTDSVIKRQAAKDLTAALWRTNRGCISIQVIQEFTNAALKKRIFTETAKIESVIRDLGEWNVHMPTIEDVLDAARLRERFQLSFWDAMIVHSAAALGCTVFYSEDLNHGQVIDGVRIVNPFLEQSPSAT